MRVLHVTRDLAPRTNGGISVAVDGLLRAAKNPWAAISFDAWRPRSKKHAPARRVTEERANVFRVSKKDDLIDAAELARRFAPDVVHVHHAGLFEEASALPVEAPLVLSVHVVQRALRELRGLDEPTRSERAQTRAMSASHLVLAPSRATMRDLARFEPAIANKLRFAPLGIDAAPAPPIPVEDTVLFVGRFADVKGLDTLAEAAAQIEARVRIVGGLPDNQRAEARWRQRLARLSSVELAGWLDQSELEDAYATASVLVAPSWYETYGLAVAEAMMRARPVIASDVGALPERIRSGWNGVLVEPRNAAALSEATNRLLASPDRSRFGKRARDAAQQWTWEQSEPLTRAIYDELSHPLPP